MNRPLAALVCILSMMLAACGSDGSTSGFTTEREPIDPDLVAALSPDDDPDAVPGVQRNFLTGCVKGFGDAVPELETVQRAGLLAVCRCSFEQLVTYSYNEVGSVTADGQSLDDAAFDIFTELEDDIRIGETDLPTEVLDLIRICVRSEAGL